MFFTIGVLVGFLLGVLLSVARDLRDLKNIFKREYREIRNKVYTPQNGGNVLTNTPESVDKIEKDEMEKILYGEK
jgi:hypothetical protein